MRLALIAAAVIIFRSTKAGAFAFLVSSTIMMPIFYTFKNKAIPNDITALRKYLISSTLVAITTLVLPLLHVAFTGISSNEPIPLPQLVAIVPISALIWIISVWLFKHPLSERPWFTRYLSRTALQGTYLKG